MKYNWTRNLLSGAGEAKLMSVGNVVDPDFLTMFSFPLVRGNAETALSDPQAISRVNLYSQSYRGIHPSDRLYQFHEPFHRPQRKAGKGSGHPQSSGASKPGLLVQFIGESILIATLAGLLSVAGISMPSPTRRIQQLV
jgi:hypothetical protein